MAISRATQSRKILLGAFVVSLVANAFFVGAVATDYFRVGHKAKATPRFIQFEMRWLAGRLPEGDLKTVERAVSDMREQTAAHFDRLRQIRGDLGRLTAVPEPDRAAIDQRLADIRGEFDAMLAEVQNASMDALLALPPAARTKLADSDPPRR
jgi:uncharacterized membrane protein